MVSNCIFTVWVPFSRKIYGVSRGVRVSDGDLKMQSILKHWPSRQARRIPWLWVSNRGEKHPCWHTILLAKSSVLYALSALLWKRCSTRVMLLDLKEQENRLYLWSGKTTNTGLVSSADRAYIKAPVFRKLTELRDNLSSTLKWAGSHFKASPPWLHFTKTAEAVNGSGFPSEVTPKSWTVF